MRNSIVWIALSASLLFSATERVEITADRFSANESIQKTEMHGNVVVIKGADELRSGHLVVFFDEKRNPIRYEASENVSFVMTMKDGKRIKGTAQKGIYNLGSDEYTLSGKAQVQEIGKENSVRGETIIINRKNGFANVAGGEQNPAKMIFTYEGKEPKQ